jgi:outer membrane immunogenic protein
MRIFTAALAALFPLGAAMAADLPAHTYTKAPAIIDPAYNWTGFYLGATVGWGSQAAHSEYSAAPNPLSVVVIPGLATGAIPADIKQTGNGFLGGLTAGINIQTGSVVWGIEGDISWLNVKNAGSVAGAKPPVPLPGNITTTETDTDWLATLRGRAGFLIVPQTLLYGTGGLAAGRIKSSGLLDPQQNGSICVTNSLCSTGSGSKTKYGWVAGAGVEHMFAPGWTGKFEYLYYDLGSFSYVLGEAAPFLAASAGAPNVITRVNVTGQIVRVGANYKF